MGINGKITAATWVKWTDKNKTKAVPVVLEDEEKPKPKPVVKDVPSAVNYALDFDGKTSGVDVPTLNYDGTHPITIEAWVNARQLGTVLRLPNIGIATNIPPDKWQLTVFAGKPLGMMYFTTHDIQDLNVKWHLAGVFDGKELRFYVNGNLNRHNPIRLHLPDKPDRNLQPNEQVVGDFSSDYRFFCIGKSQPGAPVESLFDGIIDEVRISNIARYTSDFKPQKRFTPDEHTMALYHFDQGNGDIVKDSSGNGHDGKITAAKWVKVDDQLNVVGRPGESSDKKESSKEATLEMPKKKEEPEAVPKEVQKKDNYALEFDGKTSGVKMPTLKYNGKTPITMEAWINARQLGTLARFRNFGIWPSNPPDNWQLNVHSKAPLRNYFTAHELLQCDTQCHVAGVFDGAGLRLYVNGDLSEKNKDRIRLSLPNEPDRNLQPNEQIVGDFSSDYDYFSVGSTKPGDPSGSFFNGIIDEVRISNIARYTKDFTPQRRFEPDEHTLALFHFDEGSGDVAKDSSGNHHDGKITGAKWVKVDDQLNVIGRPGAAEAEKDASPKENAEKATSK